MSITVENVSEKWREIECFEGGYSQICVSHPLEWYIGYKEINQKAILIISNEEMELPVSSKSIFASKGKREDGRWALSLALLRAEQGGVFETLCSDILTYSQNASTQAEALRLLFKRYKQWELLLEHQKKSLLDENNRKGLIGELLFLISILNNGTDPLVAVQGWVGPDGADQDFFYADGWNEVKAIGVSASSIQISSLEQLSSTNDGKIVVMRIDKCAPNRNEAFSLSDIVWEARKKLMNNNDALEEYDSKLLKYGYIDMPEYSEQRYYYSGKQEYYVTTGFPRIVKGEVPLAVISVSYAIDLSSIDAWRMKG